MLTHAHVRAHHDDSNTRIDLFHAFACACARLVVTAQSPFHCNGKSGNEFLIQGNVAVYLKSDDDKDDNHDDPLLSHGTKHFH